MDDALDLVNVERMEAALQLDGGVVNEDVDGPQLGRGRRGAAERGQLVDLFTSIADDWDELNTGAAANAGARLRTR